MCERVFIASDHSLPLIKFDPEGYFWVGQVERTEQWEEYDELRKLFTKPHLYYACTHEGCGCGFRYDFELLEYRFPARTLKEYQGIAQWGQREYSTEAEYQNTKEDAAKSYQDGRKSVQALSEYLKAAVATSPVELYIHWAGDPIGEPERREVAPPEFWGGRKFRIAANHYYMVVNGTPLPIDLDEVFEHIWNHRDEVLSSERCGCISCLEIFSPTAITEWTGQEEGMKTDALCPKCGGRTVIGSASGLPIVMTFLERVRDRYEQEIQESEKCISIIEPD